MSVGDVNQDALMSGVESRLPESREGTPQSTDQVGEAPRVSIPATSGLTLRPAKARAKKKAVEDWAAEKDAEEAGKAKKARRKDKQAKNKKNGARAGESESNEAVPDDVGPAGASNNQAQSQSALDETGRLPSNRKRKLSTVEQTQSKKGKVTGEAPINTLNNDGQDQTQRKQRKDMSKEEKTVQNKKNREAKKERKKAKPVLVEESQAVTSMDPGKVFLFSLSFFEALS